MVGEVRASGGIALNRVQDRSGEIRAQGAGNLAGAVQGLGQSIAQFSNSAVNLETVYDDRVRAYDRTAFETEYLDFVNGRSERYLTFIRDRSADPAGLTASFDASEAEQEKKFLENIRKRNPYFYEEYRAKVIRDRQGRGASMLMKELELLDAKEETNITETLNKLGTALRAGTVTMDDAAVEMDKIITGSGLSAIAKETLKKNSRQTLTTLTFDREIKEITAGRGSRKLMPGQKDVVAAGLNPFQRGLLNAIAAKESPDYNVLNGGETFTDYSDHPRRKGPGGSTAAGRYQFTAATWDEARASYYQTYGVRVPNFSPEWQDRVALHWAEVQFNRHNKLGLTFQEVMNNPTDANLRVLRKVLGDPRVPGNRNSVLWQGWEATSADDAQRKNAEFIALITGREGIAGGGSGSADGLNVWEDPRFADIPLDKKIQMANQATTAFEQTMREQAAAQKQAMEEFKKLVYDTAYKANDLGQLDALRSDPRWSVEMEEEAQKGYKAGQARIMSTNEMNSKLAAGSPLTRKDDESANNWFGDAAVEGLISGDQAAYDRAALIAQQGRYIPSNARDALKTAMHNPATQAQAMDFLASLHAGNPHILAKSGFTSEDLTDVLAYQKIAGQSANPVEAAERFEMLRQGQKLLGKSEGQIAKEAADLFHKKVGKSTVMSALDPAGFLNAGEAPNRPIMEQKLMAEAIEAFTTGYTMYGGNEDLAKEYMKESIARTWGPSLVGENQWAVMKFPPSKVFTPIDDQHELLDDHIRGGLIAWAEENDVSLPEDFSYEIVADSQTEKEWREGKKTTYNLVVTDADGQLVVSDRRWGGDSVENFILQVQATRAEEEAARIVQKEQQAMQFELALEQLKSSTYSVNGEKLDEYDTHELAVKAATAMERAPRRRPLDLLNRDFKADKDLDVMLEGELINSQPHMRKVMEAVEAQLAGASMIIPPELRRSFLPFGESFRRGALAAREDYVTMPVDPDEEIVTSKDRMEEILIKHVGDLVGDNIRDPHTKRKFVERVSAAMAEGFFPAEIPQVPDTPEAPDELNILEYFPYTLPMRQQHQAKAWELLNYGPMLRGRKFTPEEARRESLIDILEQSVYALDRTSAERLADMMLQQMEQ